MLFADGDIFPPWMLWTSISLASGAAGLFVYGARRPKVKAVVAPQAVGSPDAAGPPPPLVPVAAAPLAALSANAERRIGFRRIGNPVEVLVCDQEFKDAPVRGWVVDRSRHGLRLSVMDKHTGGTILQVRPTSAAESVPWLPVEVRNAQPGDQSTWELGCKFTTEPEWELLLQFG